MQHFITAGLRNSNPEISHLPEGISVSFFGVGIKSVDSTFIKTKLDPVALVRDRTIQTERPPLVGEVSAKFGG
jgi:hypothetical protein